MTDKAKGRIGKVKYKSYNNRKWFPRKFVKLIAGLALLMVLGVYGCTDDSFKKSELGD